jgi:hypothetical protein
MNISGISREVKIAIHEAREELSPYLKRLDLEKLSKHNRGYLDYANDPVGWFIDVEMHSHARIVNFLYKTLSPKSRIMDIGFFIPVVPITLAKLGFHVSSIENLAFYDNALNDIISLASQSHGIKVLDFDILHDDIESMNQFDAVILSAILEHLNGSPKEILKRAQALGDETAYYIIVVPNVAALHKRISFLLKGAPPFPSISVYFQSAYPFTGHNREYTIRDLKYVLKQSGFETVHFETFNKPIVFNRSFKAYFLNMLARIGPESLADGIIAVSRRSL